MRALCVLHDHVSSTGYVGERLKELGWQVEDLLVVPGDRFFDPDVDCQFPDPRGFDLLVLMGAPWSAYDDGLIGRWLNAELYWLADAHRADVPILGICFGAQALARALGGEVRMADRAEVGWTSVDTDDPELVASGPWFQWHYDQFTVPEGAREIARNDVCPQAFQIGRSLGVQFHPELTPDGLDQWLANGGANKATALGLQPDQLRSNTASSTQGARARADQLVDAYLSRSFAATHTSR